MKSPVVLVSCLLASLICACGSIEEVDSMAEVLARAPEVAPCEEAPDGMVCVEGGGFDRGAVGTPECISEQPGEDALPVESIWVQTSFMDTHEVRWSDYERCVAAGFCEAPVGFDSLEPAWSGYHQPVTGISWHQASRYCEAVGKHLPTEAEWEHAARGPDNGPYPWGEQNASCERAVITSAEGPSCGQRSTSTELDLGQALSVGSRPASPRGIYDQVGNASEWVADWYLSDLSECGEDCSGIQPGGPCGGEASCGLSSLKVVRGGSWAQGAQCSTSVRREGYDPTHDTTRHVGFRCAATLEEASALTDMDYRPLEIQAADALCARSEHPPGRELGSTAWAAFDGVYQQNQGKLLRIVNQSYKGPVMIERLVCHYYERFPRISQAYQVGLSHEGRPILALRVSDRPRDGSGRPAVLFEGGQHGHELLSVDYALDAMEEIFTNLHREDVQDWLQTFDIWFIPMLNPDGADSFLHVDQSGSIGRKNGRDNDGDGLFVARNEGVDPNRNFPFQWGGRTNGSASSPYYRGEAPFTEPETRVIMRLAETQRFLASISWHTPGTTIIPPYNTRGVKNPDPDVAKQIALALKAVTSVQPNYRTFKVKQSPMPVDGSEQDWLYFEYGTLAYKVEGSKHNPPDLKTRKKSTLGVRPIYQALLSTLQSGPSVYGAVLDASGNPVEALIEIDGFTMNAEESWTTRPSDGFFERVLPAPGSYTFHFTGPDGTRSSRMIKLKKERKQVEIVLGE